MNRRKVELERVAQVAITLVWSAALVACVGSGAGVPNVEPESGAVPKSYDEIQSLIFDPICAAQCHRGGAAPMGLSLEPLRAYDSLVGVPAGEVPSLLRVAPRDPDNSYLVIKIAPRDPRRTGVRMPRNGPPFLTDPQIRAVKRWIADGAEEDWIDLDIDASIPTPDDAGMPDGQAAAADQDWQREDESFATDDNKETP